VINFCFLIAVINVRIWFTQKWKFPEGNYKYRGGFLDNRKAKTWVSATKTTLSSTASKNVKIIVKTSHPHQTNAKNSAKGLNIGMMEVLFMLLFKQSQHLSPF
jgi:hypothetical protein